MLDSLWTLSGARLVCHCRITQSCHADTIIEAFRRQYPYAFDVQATHRFHPTHRSSTFWQNSGRNRLRTRVRRRTREHHPRDQVGEAFAVQ